MAIPTADGELAMLSMYDPPSQGDYAYADSRVSSYLSGLSGSARSAATELIDAAQNKIRNLEATRRMQAIRNRATTAWMSDSVREMKTTAHLQNAMPLMRKYISAMPTARKYLEEGRIKFYDKKTRVEALTTDNYKLYANDMNSGMIQKNGESSSSTQYIQSLGSAHQRLNFTNRIALKETERYLTGVLEEEYTDPTDPWNGLMD